MAEDKKDIILSIRGMSKSFGRNKVLKHIDLDVKKGSIMGLMGENGAGKSTLMKTLLHLQAPISGSIELGDGLKKNEIGYLPQQTLVQRDFPASVREIVLSGCQSRCGWRPFYNKEEKMVAQRAMEKMMIQDLADQCYRELSGGQQQRVLLARALCAAQKILLLDEPVSGVDQAGLQLFYTILEQLKASSDMVMLLVSHDLGYVREHADRVVLLDREVEAAGPPAEVFACDAFHRAFPENAAIPPKSAS